MSNTSRRAVVSTDRSEIVKTILSSLGIEGLNILRVTLDFEAQQVARVFVETAVTEDFDESVAAQLQTLQFAMLETTEQVAEQVAEQVEPQED